MSTFNKSKMRDESIHDDLKDFLTEEAHVYVEGRSSTRRSSFYYKELHRSKNNRFRFSISGMNQSLCNTYVTFVKE